MRADKVKEPMFMASGFRCTGGWVFRVLGGKLIKRLLDNGGSFRSSSVSHAPQRTSTLSLIRFRV